MLGKTLRFGMIYLALQGNPFSIQAFSCADEKSDLPQETNVNNNLITSSQVNMPNGTQVSDNIPSAPLTVGGGSPVPVSQSYEILGSENMKNTEKVGSVAPIPINGKTDSLLTKQKVKPVSKSIPAENNSTDQSTQMNPLGIQNQIKVSDYIPNLNTASAPKLDENLPEKHRVEKNEPTLDNPVPLDFPKPTSSPVVKGEPPVKTISSVPQSNCPNNNCGGRSSLFPLPANRSAYGMMMVGPSGGITASKQKVNTPGAIKRWWTFHSTPALTSPTFGPWVYPPSWYTFFPCNSQVRPIDPTMANRTNPPMMPYAPYRVIRKDNNDPSLMKEPDRLANDPSKINPTKSVGSQGAAPGNYGRLGIPGSAYAVSGTNSVDVQNIKIGVPNNNSSSGNGVIPVNGQNGSSLPVNAKQPVSTSMPISSLIPGYRLLGGPRPMPPQPPVQQQPNNP